MSADDRAEVDAALDRRSGFTNAAIHAAFQSLGYAVGRQTVGVHRRKMCRCFSEADVMATTVEADEQFGGVDCE